MHEDFKPTVVDLAPDTSITRAGLGAWWRSFFGRTSAALSATRSLLGRHALFRRAPALLEGRGGTLVVLELDDMAEVNALYGSPSALRAVSELARLLWRAAGREGLVARTGPVQFAVLLPGLDRDGAMRALEASLGWPCRLELELGDDEVVLLPAVRIEPCEPGTDLPSLSSRASALLSCQREHEALRQRWLRHSRERWSRPMAL